MPDHLEMVVAGKRQAALPTEPEVSHRMRSWNGFLLEEHSMGSMELPDHWIPFYMVSLQQFVGKRSVFENGRQRESVIQRDDCVIVAPHEVRQFRLEGQGKGIFLAIEPVVLQEVTEGTSPRSPNELIRRHNGKDPLLRSLLLNLHAEVVAGCPSGPLRSEAICYQLAEQLLHRYSIGRVTLGDYRGGLSGGQMRRAVDYIEAYLDVELRSEDIAKAAGLSKYHFGKAFKQSAGMTLHNYVLARRMRRSQDLLVRTDMPLAAIADAAGFANQSHFTAVFSARIGISPSSYRKMGR